ncbi:hypothetical protein IJS77_04180 [bacterium]|nr:hypothetical protein [bacterium]
MRIGNNFKINFKSIDDNYTSKPIYHETSELSEQLPYPSVQTLQAYAVQKPQSGFAAAVIRPDYDALKLVYSIKPPFPDTQKIKFIYTIPNDSTERESFSTPKNKKTGTFKVEIPVLDRKTNSIIPEVKIKLVEYFNEANIKSSEEIPENMFVNPKDIMTVKENRTVTINGESSSAEMDSISEGVSVGKVVEKEYEDMIRYKGTEPIIVILSQADMEQLFLEISEGTFTLPMNVKGILASPKHYKQGGMLTDCLGHAVSRLRGRKTFALTDEKTLDNIKKTFVDNPKNPYVKLELCMNKLNISGLKELPKPDRTEVKIPKNSLVNKLLSPDDEDFTQEAVGLKAYNLGRLRKLQQAGGFKVPSFFVVPAGVWDCTKKSPENVDVYGDVKGEGTKMGSYHFYTQKADALETPSTELDVIRHMIVNDMVLPKEIRTALKEKAEKVFDLSNMIAKEGCLIARSSFNGEDSDTIATQGLYDSFPGIRTAEHLFRGIKEVWASKWSDLAYMSRRNHKIPHRAVQPNVIVQEVVPVDYTFTINTADPRGNDKNKIVCQLSQGVYSCFPNSPYIFEYDKTTGEIKRTAFATKKRMKPIYKMIMDDFKNEKYEITDYSKDPLNMSRKEYSKVMEKIFDVAKFIEKKFGGKPQDIEGGVIFKRNSKNGELEPEIHIWQTRDVHLIKR